MLVMLVNY